MEAIGCVRAKTFVRTSVPRNSALWYRKGPVSHRSACIWVEKSSKTHPNIILGSNGGYWVCSCENVRPNFGTRKRCILVPKRTNFSSFCMHSGSQILRNTPKHHFRSNGGHWVCSC